MIFLSTHGIRVDINFQLLISVLLCNIFILILEVVSMLKTTEEIIKNILEKLQSRRNTGDGHTRSHPGRGAFQTKADTEPLVLSTVGSIWLEAKVKNNG